MVGSTTVEFSAERVALPLKLVHTFPNSSFAVIVTVNGILTVWGPIAENSKVWTSAGRTVNRLLSPVCPSFSAVIFTLSPAPVRMTSPIHTPPLK